MNNFHRIYHRPKKKEPPPKEITMPQPSNEAVERAQKEIEKIVTTMRENNAQKVPILSFGILTENFWSVLSIILIVLSLMGKIELHIFWCFVIGLVPIALSFTAHGIMKIGMWWAKRKILKEGKGAR